MSVSFVAPSGRHLLTEPHAHRACGCRSRRSDAARDRGLPGQIELMTDLAALLPEHASVVDLGGASGAHLRHLGQAHRELGSITLVESCPELATQARRRARRMGWDHLRVHEADPVTWTPTERVDAVICNHSLTSIDQWQAMLDHVRTWLRPGGLLAVADFGVSTREMDASLEDHAPLTRRFWTAWLARDGINLDPRMLPALRSGFTQQLLIQDQAWVSWVPVKAPWFRFIGRR